MGFVRCPGVWPPPSCTCTTLIRSMWSWACPWELGVPHTGRLALALGCTEGGPLPCASQTLGGPVGFTWSGPPKTTAPCLGRCPGALHWPWIPSGLEPRPCSRDTEAAGPHWGHSWQGLPLGPGCTEPSPTREPSSQGGDPQGPWRGGWCAGAVAAPHSSQRSDLPPWAAPRRLEARLPARSPQGHTAHPTQGKGRHAHWGVRCMGTGQRKVALRPRGCLLPEAALEVLPAFQVCGLAAWGPRAPRSHPLWPGVRWPRRGQRAERCLCRWTLCVLEKPVPSQGRPCGPHGPLEGALGGLSRGACSARRPGRTPWRPRLSALSLCRC